MQIAGLSALSVKNAVEIRWSTATEIRNHGFEIERRKMEDGNEPTSQGQDESSPTCPPSFWRKADQPLAETNQPHPSPFTVNHSPWTKVGFVPGAGTSSSPREYSFVDEPDQPGRYAYRMKQIDQNGAFTYTDAVEVEVGLVPEEFTLSQNYPNPFNPTTTIEFTLPEDGHVSLKLYDVTGQLLMTVLDEVRPAGYHHSVIIDSSHLGSGIYFLRLESRGQELTRRIALVR